MLLTILKELLKHLRRTGADIVGGPMRIANGNPVQNAIGYATSTVLGVGNSSFHFEDFEGFTDSVYLGAWKKKIFEKTGLFDTTFRNRMTSFTIGQKVWVLLYTRTHRSSCTIIPRKTLGLLFKQYYQYGMYKPMVLKKIKSAINLRHIIPSFFVLYLVTLPFFLLSGWYFLLLPLLAYLVAAFSFALISKKSIKEIFLIPVVYFTLHISYGAGFLAGLSLKP